MSQTGSSGVCVCVCMCVCVCVYFTLRFSAVMHDTFTHIVTLKCVTIISLWNFKAKCTKMQRRTFFVV